MSTAINYATLLKKAKGAKKAAPAPQAPVSPNAPTGASPPVIGFVRRPINPSSIVDQYKTSPDGLDRAFYVPNFISPEEEQYALSMIYAPVESPVEATSKWVQLSHRRLRVHGGIPDSQSTLMKPLPTWIDEFLDHCAEPFLANTPPLEAADDRSQKSNHVLLNEYSGGMGIAPHFDGPLYNQRVLVLNLQSPAVMWFYHVKADSTPSLIPAFNLVLEPRSLLIFEGSLYTELKHGIENGAQDDLSGKTPANLRLLDAALQERFLHGDTIISRGSLPRLSLTLRRIKNAGKNEADIATRAEQEELLRAEVNFYRNVSEHN